MSTLLYRISKGWIIGLFVLIVGTLFLPYSFMMMVTAAIAVGFSPMLFISGLVSHRRGVKIAKFYLLSWIFPAFGVMLFNGGLVGLIPASGYTHYFLHFGVALELICLSFTLAYHLKVATKKASELKIGLKAATIVQSSLMTINLPETFLMSPMSTYPAMRQVGSYLAVCRTPKVSMRL